MPKSEDYKDGYNDGLKKAIDVIREKDESLYNELKASGMKYPKPTATPILQDIIGKLSEISG